MHLQNLGTVLTLAGLASGVSAAPQLRSTPQYIYNAERADAVKQTFQIAWDGYYQYAFPHDSLLPQTNTYQDDRNGWGASAVDAFSTALVMENWDVVDIILDFVGTIDFNSSPDEVDVFETNIRYVGGMLAAYDLMTGPLASQFGRNKTQVDAVLAQAKQLGTNLAAAFNTTTGIPDNYVYLNPPRPAGSTTNGVATIGSLVLELTRLSDLTGDPSFGELAQKGESYLLSPQPQPLAEPFPGLVGTNLDIATGQFTDGDGGWVGGDDSFYEYLIKSYLYDPSRFGQYKDRWVLAADSSIQYLASHPTTRPDLTFLAQYQGTTLYYTSQHLACFDGGNFILGGLTLGEQKYVDFGLSLVDACFETYNATATRIGPEDFQWQDDKASPTATNNPGPTASSDAAFYADAGFWITSAQYELRPEVMESIYYAYRATGDPKYQEYAWQAYVAINATTRVGSGYSDINDVNSPGGGGSQNHQETFFFAEVLKYSYLIHAQDAPYQVQAGQNNQFVFNTEAHPLRLAAGIERPAQVAYY